MVGSEVIGFAIRSPRSENFGAPARARAARARENFWRGQRILDSRTSGRRFFRFSDLRTDPDFQILGGADTDARSALCAHSYAYLRGDWAHRARAATVAWAEGVLKRDVQNKDSWFLIWLVVLVVTIIAAYLRDAICEDA